MHFAIAQDENQDRGHTSSPFGQIAQLQTVSAETVSAPAGMTVLIAHSQGRLQQV